MFKQLFMGCMGLAFLVSCKTSQKIYFQEIEKIGVIPFQYPVSTFATGTLLRGKPGNILAIAPHTRCFPESVNGEPTHLRWKSDVIIPQSYRKWTLDLGGDFNSLIAGSALGIQIHLKQNKTQKIEIEIEEAQMEMLDQLALKDFYQSEMTDACKEILNQFPFILEALRVNKMSFSFLDSSGGKFNLTSVNMGDFVLLGADTDWHIEQGSKLVLATPKYIGYKLAKLAPDNDGRVQLIAAQIKNGDYVWEDSFAVPSRLFFGKRIKQAIRSGIPFN